MFSKKFNKGRYYIGDLCYVIEKREYWLKLLEETAYFNNEEQFYKGYSILAGGTAYGNGIYKDNYGKIYAVIAGLIGIMPIEATELEDDNISELGNIVDFKEDFIVEISDGSFVFGDIIIDISNENEDEDDEDDEYDKDYECEEEYGYEYEYDDDEYEEEYGYEDEDDDELY